MGCIPPIPDFNTGAPTCPLGYTYDPVQNLCCPNSQAPVDFSDPTIRKLVTGLPDVSIDPAQASRLGMQGVAASGIIERAVVAFLRGIITLVGPLLYEAASLIDDFLVVLSNVFFYAQGQRSTGYYLLAAALMEDLLGIAVDGNQLYKDFQSKGRLSSMVTLGGSLWNTLAGEFTGVAQSNTSGAFTTQPGKGIGGLPAVTLSPTQGMDGARAFLGFAASFAMREGNTDLLADYLPYGLGHWFKDFAEDFSKSLGIGRMARLVYKPLVKVTVADRVQEALNMQYRPTLPTPRQAYAMWNQGTITVDQLRTILSMHGFADDMSAALQYESLERPTRAELRAGHAAGAIDDTTYNTWMARIGYTPELIALLDAYEDTLPMRDSVLAAARSFASQYLHGRITKVQYTGAIDSIKNKLDGSPILTTGEVDNLKRLASIAGAAPRRHMGVVQLYREYLDSLITLQEFEAAATALGYSQDDVTLLTQELLISEKRAASKAAAAAAKALRGPLYKLTIAQMEAGYVAGILDIATIEEELAARKYTPVAIADLVAQFNTKAGKPPATGSTA